MSEKISLDSSVKMVQILTYILTLTGLMKF